VAKTAADYFENLSYGPCPEGDENVQAWFKSHDRKFGLFIENKWVHPPNRAYSKSICPATKGVLAETCEGTKDDIDNAVISAKKAFASWSKLSGHERAKYIYSIARHMQKHARMLSVVESLDNGKPFRETKNADVPIMIRHLYHHAGWAQLMDEEFRDYKPVGVVGAIVPWNFPLMLLTWKVAPALAMGNCVVLKPATHTRLSALLFAQICAEAGLPPGVLSVITGTGKIGSDLADHADVNKVAFTGSTPIGAMLRERTAGTGKAISLELGGKSPVIIFDTADLDSAVEGTVDAIFFNQGQVCCAGSRALVQENIIDKYVKKLKRRLSVWKIGHSLEKDIDSGALVDINQYNTIKQFVDEAKAQGSDVWMADVPCPSLDVGFFWPPTIISNVSTSSNCVREEIFGPVLTIQSFRSVEEAIELANNSKFGLGGSVWTENISLALEVALSIKTGAMWVNCHNIFDAAAGFGGYKESGFGRDGGRDGLYEYIRPKWLDDNAVKKATTAAGLTFPTDKKKIWWGKAPSAIVASIPIVNEEIKSVVANGGVKGLDLSQLSVVVDRTPKLYIDGKQKRPDGEYSMPVYSNCELKEAEHVVISQVGDGNRKDIRDAVEAANAAKGGWGKRAAYNRSQICFYVAENLMARYAEFVERIRVQTGRSQESCEDEVDKSIERLFYYAAYADKYGGRICETTLYGVTASVNEPSGSIAILCPDRYPLLAFVSLVFPAVVRGNTVIVVPSPVSPLCATDLYQVFDTSDLPPGVVNIVTGHRDQLAKTLCEHYEVNAIWYHGSAMGSQAVECESSSNMKRSWVNYGVEWDWMDDKQTQGEEFLRHASEIKHVWIPMGESK
jgi:aldehyde dehydrogenase (NAD+)